MQAEADYAMTERAFQGRSADDRLMIKFELFPHPNQEKSEAAGHPVYDDREFITIIVPGDKTSIVHRPVWKLDTTRFSRQYQQFKLGQTQTVSGLPLKMWGGMTLGQAKEFEYFNVQTVEQLAVMNDGHGIQIQGFNGLKRRAQDYLAQTKEQAPLLEMRAALEKKDNDIESLQNMLREQGERIAQLEKPKARRAKPVPVAAGPDDADEDEASDD